MLLGVLFAVLSAQPAHASELRAVYTAQGKEKPLKTWTLPELQKLKKRVSREKDPADGKVQSWQGILFSDFIDRSTESLSNDEKANLDLIVIKGAGGAQAFVPRFLVTRYPVLLALKRGAEELPAAASVVPWSSKPAIVAESLPLGKFFVSGISEIELTSYQSKFGSIYLKRRTDPSAMRGEKIFLQRCTSQHGREAVALLDGQGSEGPMSAGCLQGLSEKERKAVSNYLAAYRSEN